MDHTHDVLVLGHGAAGAAFVEECHRRGLRPGVVQMDRPGQATRVAAGLVNPVVLRRYMPCWRAGEMLRTAEAFYRSLSSDPSGGPWHPVPLLEVFTNANARHQWTLQQADPERRAWMSAAQDEGSLYPQVRMPHGHGIVRACAWLDTAGLLDRQEAQLRAQGQWLPQAVAAGEVEESSTGVRIGAWSAPWLVCCEGPFTDHAGMVPVKGENLLVRVPGPALQHVLHHGVFVLPVGDDRYRVGATFQWDDPWSGPTPEARRWLLDRLSRVFTPDVRVEVEAQYVGVRPTARDRRPILGRTTARQAILNGLGARGAMLAPWCAQHLAAHLFDGAPLDPEVDQARTFA